MVTFRSYIEVPHIVKQSYTLGEYLTPEFLRADPVNIRYWPRLCDDFAAYQVAILDESQEKVVGVVNTVPLHWTQPLANLPKEGWDWALANANLKGNWQCALLVAIQPEYRAQGLAQQGLNVAKKLGHSLGHQGLLVPLRPTRKFEFIHLSMEEYLAKRTQTNQVFDPWLRLHLSMGAQPLHICHHSMTIKLSYEKWIEYGAYLATKSDELLIPHGLVPIQRQADGSGLYIEPNIWLAHRVTP